MAIYPATNNEEAIALNIQNSEQFHQILQGDIDAEITTYEGLGKIPSVAKAMNEAAAYRLPTAWVDGETELDLLQPRRFDGDVYVPITVPAPLGASPDNTYWRLYRPAVAIQQITETRSGSDIISGNQLPLADITYIPNTNNIMVFVNRSLYVSGVDYTEPSSARIDFIAGSIPDTDDEIFVVSGASTTNVLNPAFSGTTIRSWRFSGNGGSTYDILGADSDLPEAYIVRVDGVDLEPTLNYTVDSNAGTISFTDDLGNPQTYDSSQRINVLGIGQVVTVTTVTDGVETPASTEVGQVAAFSSTDGQALTNTGVFIDTNNNIYGHGATVIEVDTATYTITEADNGKIIHFRNNGGCLVDLPGTEIPYVSNIQFVAVQFGTSPVTFQETLGSVIRARDGFLTSGGQYSTMSAYRHNSTDWIVIGGEV